MRAEDLVIGRGFIAQALIERLKSEKGDVSGTFHVTGLTRNDESISRPVDTMVDNVLSTAGWFEEARRWNRTLVYTSSAVVYSPVRTPYQISKIAADSLARFYNEHGGDIRIMRLAEVIGPGMRNGPIAAWREQYRKNGVIDVWEGSQKKDYIYISDAVEALLLAVDLPAGVYDVCSGIQTEILDLAKMLQVPYRLVPSPRPVAPIILQPRDERFPITVALEDAMEFIRKAEFV